MDSESDDAPPPPTAISIDKEPSEMSETLSDSSSTLRFDGRSSGRYIAALAAGFDDLGRLTVDEAADTVADGSAGRGSGGLPEMRAATHIRMCRWAPESAEYEPTQTTSTTVNHANIT